MNTEDKFIIQGLGGQKTLRGAIKINGAKNAALKAIAAAVLFDGPVQLQNVPHNEDVKTMNEILNKLGATVEWSVMPAPDRSRGQVPAGIQNHDQVLIIDASKISTTNLDPRLACNMRASVVLTGPLLGRFEKVSLPAPGGCVIGARPIDIFLDGYKKMGAEIKENGLYEISGKLKGTEITFKRISVGATETLMMAAILARGKTILKNCAREPEIVNVAGWLNDCGAKIDGAGTKTMKIEGTGGKLLSSKNSKPFVTIPDRVEAGSFLILGALCAAKLTIEDCYPPHLKTVVDLLRKSGADIVIDNTSTIVVSNDSVRSFKSFDVTTREYPGVATDLQAPLTVFLTQALGKSRVNETIFEKRFEYVSDLKEMGADINIINDRKIEVRGPTPLDRLSAGRELRAHDIRAGFAIVLAAFVGKGRFTVGNIRLIDRGYEKLEERLRLLGANIERV